MKKYQIAVIGGGITGLSVAYYLHKAGKEEDIPLQVTLLEEKQRLGGKIWTERWNGFVMEKGPDSFLERKTSAKQLALELGLEDQLVRNKVGQSYILHNNQLHLMPEGAVMGVPTQLTPFMYTQLFSLAGKLRASLDLLLPRQKADKDISVGEFFRKRLGNEVVDNLIEPLLSGIYAADLDQLSLKATFPHFAQMEEKHRSLILGMKKTRAPKPAQQEPKGQFLTLKNGLYTLVEAIEEQLPADSIVRGCRIIQIKKELSKYQLICEDGHKFTADFIIATTPYPALQQIIPTFKYFLPPKAIPATSVATVLMGFDEADVDLPYEGTGFVIPRNEQTTITACTWTNKKWPHTAPPGMFLMRLYVGRCGDEAIVEEPDDVILQQSLEDIKKVMKIKNKHIFYRISRWRHSMPQYTVGHVDWVNQLEEELAKNYPGLFVAGASYRGIGIPDCINQAKAAVEKVLKQIQTQAVFDY